ncbi:hypothetical protein K7Z75_24740 [Mycobacterium avium subsp. hominissuis]|uniref:hypothetical protein n=1 Tax=Mycobacterium avium TaxID=1764 RepID=UPI00293A3468|nr:hypothetical protein [Mycobacterium avium]MDV3306835.1 hypothetical protein [Mycobacterium avium subsp. hominissuis]
MGWWTTNETGTSFAADGDLMWGDSVADMMDETLGRIVEEFQRSWNRNPSMRELIAGLRFSASTADITP